MWQFEYARDTGIETRLEQKETIRLSSQSTLAIRVLKLSFASSISIIELSQSTLAIRVLKRVGHNTVAYRIRSEYARDTGVETDYDLIEYLAI